jgi:hypothetical protein
LGKATAKATATAQYRVLSTAQRTLKLSVASVEMTFRLGNGREKHSATPLAFLRRFGVRDFAHITNRDGSLSKAAISVP